MTYGKKVTAVLASLDTFAEVREALLWLEAQTVRGEILILLVCQDIEAYELPPDFEREFSEVEVVACGKGKTLAEARAHGVRLTTTEYVVLLEDHAFPEPEWFERVLARLEEGWAAVGGAFQCANPKTFLAQGQTLLGYGQWLAPVQGGEMAFVSGHGTAYRLEVLRQVDDELENQLVAEALLLQGLHAQGHRFYCEAAALTWHYDSSTWEGSLNGTASVGRSLAARRSARWPAWRRVAYAAAFPLIALVRWQRAAVAYLRVRGNAGFSPVCLLFAATLASIWSFNECLGFLGGFGASRQSLSDFEHNRKRHLNPGEWPRPQRPPGMTPEEFKRRTLPQ